MTDADETQRIEGVYTKYQQSGYGQKWSGHNKGNQWLAREQELALECVLRDHGFFTGIKERRVLDVGCGAGRILGVFEAFGVPAENLLGVDLLPDRIEQARTTHPRIRFECANATTLEVADASFDAVSFFVVFSSVLDDKVAQAISAEAIRVLKPGGLIVWYDFRFNNPWNQNVRGVSERRALALFPGFTSDLRLITLLPPLARRLGPLTGLLYPLLSGLPLLRTHQLGVLRKPL